MGENLFPYLQLLLFTGKVNKRPSMSGGDFAAPDAVLDLQRQLEKTEKIADSGAVFAHLLGNLLLCQVTLRCQAFEGESNFDSIKIFALNILDKRKLKFG